MNNGKKLRMGKIFREDHKTVIVAIDHGLFHGPLSGIEELKYTIERLIKGKPDAILANLGVINRFAEELSALPATILTIPSDGTAIAYVEQAARLGIDALKVAVFEPFERNKPYERYSIFGPIAVECEKWGLPLMVEPSPIEKGEIVTKPEIIRNLARIGFEYGADLLKIAYTGSKETFREIVKVCPIPVTVLGGPTMKTKFGILEVVRDAMEAGGSGVVIGRNVWQHHDPAAMIKAISKIVHENVTVEDAALELNSTVGRVPV